MPGHYDRFKDQPKIPSSGGGGPAGMGSPPPSQPTSPMDYFGSMFTAPGSSTANVTGTSEEADKGISGPGKFGFGGGSGGGQGTGGQGTGGQGTGGQDDDTTTTTTTTTTEKTDAEIEALKAKTPEDLLKVLQDKALGQKALSQKQLIRIVNLLAANQQNPNVLNDEEQSAFSNLFDENKLEAFVENYRVNYPNYFEGTIPGTGAVVMALADSVTAGDFRDDDQNPFDLPQLEDEIGSFTLQGLNKALTSSEKEYLKKFRPDLYYGTSSVPGFGAQTSGGLADLASLDASKYADKNSASYNPDFANQIFAARADLDRMGKDMFGNTQGGGQGGGGGIPSVATPVTPPPSGPTPPPQQPTLPPGITPPLNPSTRFPDSVIRDYTQLGLPQIYGNQQMPNYANFYQGQQPVGLQNYLDALRRRFGIG
jgi:hypothetical protein